MCAHRAPASSENVLFLEVLVPQRTYYYNYSVDLVEGYTELKTKLRNSSISKSYDENKFTFVSLKEKGRSRQT